MMSSSNSDYEHYYVPESSKLPIYASLFLFITVYGAATLINNVSGMPATFTGSWVHWIPIIGFLCFARVLYVWFRTTIRENLQGLPSAQLKRSYTMGMMWFIFSEVMFFFAFFGALFYVRSFAGPWLGGEGDKGVANLLWQGFQYDWPLMITPQQAAEAGAGQITAVNGEFGGPGKHMSFPGFSAMFGWLPLYNTIILLSSSFTVHVAHHALKEGNKSKMKNWLGITVLLGAIFVVLQAVEYYEAYAHYGLTLNAGIYGSTFFMLTGFHGFHVCLGAFMLFVMWMRATRHDHFTPEDHFGFEAASWYWHFVDVVWVGLVLVVYVF
ncbi:MAG: cytochrome c oxidase subunit 3 [Pseudomonadales bacterium]